MSSTPIDPGSGPSWASGPEGSSGDQSVLSTPQDVERLIDSILYSSDKSIVPLINAGNEAPDISSKPWNDNISQLAHFLCNLGNPNSSLQQNFNPYMKDYISNGLPFTILDNPSYQAVYQAMTRWTPNEIVLYSIYCYSGMKAQEYLNSTGLSDFVISKQDMWNLAAAYRLKYECECLHTLSTDSTVGKDLADNLGTDILAIGKEFYTNYPHSQPISIAGGSFCDDFGVETVNSDDNDDCYYGFKQYIEWSDTIINAMQTYIKTDTNYNG